MWAGSWGDKNGWSAAGNVKAGLIRFADVSGMGGGERKKRVQMALRLFRLQSKMELLSTDMKKSLGGKLVWFWYVKFEMSFRHLGGNIEETVGV